VESRTTVEKTEASRNERAGWAARTPDIESEERNAEIGNNGDAETNPGCAGKMKPGNRTNSGEDDRDERERPRIQRGAIDPENG
jgi:hypothetical protein